VEIHNIGTIPYTILVRGWHYTTPPPAGKITADLSDPHPPQELLFLGTLVPLAKSGKCGKMAKAATLRRRRSVPGLLEQVERWRNQRPQRLEATPLPGRMSGTEERWALRWTLVIVGLTCLPYLVAWLLTPADAQYTGLLINHYDGESYYAKMQQGARGDWLFHLPFTPEPHEGALVYTFYLALGQLAGVLGLPIPWVYHLARAAGNLFFLLVAYRFVARFLEPVQTRRAAFLLLGFSAGFGWLLAPLGLFTADLWVAEGFTFLSMLVNPHFPLAIGLMLAVFMAVLDLQVRDGNPRRRLAGAGAASLGLSLVHPIAVPIALAVLGVYLLLLAWQARQIPWREVLGTGLATAAAAPVLISVLIAFSTNSALVAWSAQNLTPSPPPWDYALAYGLILMLALGGMGVALRRRARTDLFLLGWVGGVAVLLYVPFALQRRFITGLHVPLVILAALGLECYVWPRVRARRRALATGLLVGFTALSNLFVLLVSVSGVAQGRHPLVMTTDEAAACTWLEQNTTWTDTVLAPPDSGHFIPAWAGNRVVYGHPFETIDAETKEAEVAQFYSPDATTAERHALLDRYGVRYVFAPLATSLDPAALGLTPAWTGEEAILYRVEGTS
jgi:hypothetical protein